MIKMTNWRVLITEAFDTYDESWEKVIACTLNEQELDVQFDNGYGGTEGKHFTLWTDKRVYFPVCYDGSEWVESVSRDPCNEATSHVGG